MVRKKLGTKDCGSDGHGGWDPGERFRDSDGEGGAMAAVQPQKDEGGTENDEGGDSEDEGEGGEGEGDDEGVDGEAEEDEGGDGEAEEDEGGEAEAGEDERAAADDEGRCADDERGTAEGEGEKAGNLSKSNSEEDRSRRVQEIMEEALNRVTGKTTEQRKRERQEGQMLEDKLMKMGNVF